MTASNDSPRDPKNWPWQEKLAKFVADHKQDLAALAWVVAQNQGETPGVIGVDFEPAPHLVFCSVEAIATLNQKVENQLQEILGLIDGYQPDKEVLLLGIGSSDDLKLKLVQFEPDPTPQACYQALTVEPESLWHQLEADLAKYAD